MNQSKPNIQAVFYISQSGNDSSSGSEIQPFKTLDRARTEVRKLNANMTGDIIVQLGGGRYYLDSPFVMNQQDSGSNGFNVVYTSAPGEMAVLDGGVRIDGWKPGEQGRWAADVDLDAVRQLYVNGRSVSRSTMWGFLLGNLQVMENGEGYRTTSHAAADLIGAEDVEFEYRFIWKNTRCKVAEVRKSGIYYEILMKQPEFFLARGMEGMQLNLPWMIEGAPVAFGGEGLSIFDSKKKQIQYKPWLDQDMENSEFIVPKLETLLEIQGTPEEPVRNIRFCNLGFEHATWLGANDTGFIDIQANFRVTPETLLTVRPNYSENGKVFMTPKSHDCVKSPANIICHAGHNIAFDECRFAKLGGAGLDIERGSADIRVTNCEFTNISGSAIQVADVVTDDHHPDDFRKGVRDVEIIDCDIHHIATDYKGGVGVFIGYAKNVSITHNNFHHLPYSAVSAGWGWGEIDAGGGGYPASSSFRFSEPANQSGHRIEHNHIHDVMQEMNDGGAIYTIGRMPETSISANVIHDNCGFPGGIYLDEGSADILVEKNVIYRVPKALNLNNHAQNRHLTCKIDNNICDIPPESPQFPIDVANEAGPHK